MALWIVLSLMTSAAVLAVLWPLSRRREAASAAESETLFYREQAAEIDRDRERGLISEAEAEAAKAEAGRRLLRIASLNEPSADPVGEPALRRRRAVSALALSVVPLLALAVYGAFGSPHLPSQPLAGRLAEAPEAMDLATALARIEAHLSQNPEDGRGWEVVAPVYLSLGRGEDAARAYAAALRYLGPDPVRYANHGEALAAAKGGIIAAEARAAFEEALKLDAGQAKARFYLAQAAEQDGDAGKARAAYEALLAAAPTDAPWSSVVRRQLARLDGSPPTAAPDGDAIRGMVQGLADRLDAQGGSAEEWGRLMRSYVVLGQPDKAKAALDKARRSLAGDQVALAAVDGMARDLNLAATP